MLAAWPNCPVILGKYPTNFGTTSSHWFPNQPPRRGTSALQQRRPGGGRKPLGDRQIFSGIVYVLRTGCQWKALPKSFSGSASSVHKHFQRWRGQGFFLALWQAGLAEYDEMEGTPLGNGKALMGRKAKRHWHRKRWATTPPIGGKKVQQAQPVGGRGWRPACPLIVSGANTALMSNCWRSPWIAL